MFITDRDQADPDDLIDYFSTPINISAGSSLPMISNFIGIYNYTQLELTIEVRCTAQNNRDENCVCLPGFSGPLCELKNSSSSGDCTGVICNNGGKCVDGSCECDPAYTGAMCESGKKHTVWCIMIYSYRGLTYPCRHTKLKTILFIVT